MAESRDRRAPRAGVRTGSQMVRGRRWIDEHVNDVFVQRAKADGYRSRAAYKLLELDDRDRLIPKGGVVVDLGSAPGSWCQVARDRGGDRGRVIAIDLLEMDTLAGVDFLQGDFREQPVLDALVERLHGAAVDLVLSDMAPNMSGIASLDQTRAAALGELARDFAVEHLKPGGHLVVKAFQGADFKAFIDELRRTFASVVTRKPAASRDRSSEMYVVAKGFRGRA